MPDEAIAINVIIPNWNGLHYLAPCLDSLARQRFHAFDITVVDNGSTDGSIEFLRQRASAVRLLELEMNLGFAVAVNKGIQATSADFVALLNNDTVAEPGWLEALYTAIIPDPLIGSCASKVLFLNDPKTVNSVGLFMRADGVGRDIGFGRPDGEEFAQPQEVFGASAGAALYRRSMLGQIGLFDEVFFAYGEDLDLAFRARLAGYRCRYVPSAIVYHVYAGTVGRESDLAVRLGARNMVWVLVKNMPTPLLAKHLPMILAAQLYQIVHFARRGRGRAVLQGKYEALKGLPGVLAQRREIQSSRAISLGDLEKLLA